MSHQHATLKKVHHLEKNLRSGLHKSPVLEMPERQHHHPGRRRRPCSTLPHHPPGAGLVRQLPPFPLVDTCRRRSRRLLDSELRRDERVGFGERQGGDRFAGILRCWCPATLLLPLLRPLKPVGGATAGGGRQTLLRAAADEGGSCDAAVALLPILLLLLGRAPRFQDLVFVGDVTNKGKGGVGSREATLMVSVALVGCVHELKQPRFSEKKKKTGRMLDPERNPGRCIFGSAYLPDKSVRVAGPLE